GVDVPGIAVKLDQMIASVDSLPLAQDTRPQPAAPVKTAPANWWDKLVEEILSELRQLVRVQKVDGSDAALVSPTQAYYLRENLKLRLLNARISLLARDEPAYRRDLEAAASWVARYIDTRSPAGASMVSGLQELRANGAGSLFPTINESLAAVRAYKVPRERTPQ